MYCNTIIKSGKREGMICGRKNCKIRGHPNIFDYVYNLTNEHIFLTFKEVCKIDRFDNNAIIKIFEFGKSEYDSELKSDYIDNIRYFLNCINYSSKIQKIVLTSILYTLLDLEGFYQFRFLNNNFNNTCNETLIRNIELLKNYENSEYFEYFDSIFEIGKKYFSIKKNRERRDEVNKILFFVKYISPLKDVERNIAEFLIF